MLRVKFVKGATQSAFLNLLGVPYGVVLTAQGDESPIIVDLESARLQLRQAEAEGIFTGEEVEEMERAMVEAGLDSMAAMLDKARHFPIPDGYLPLVNFKVCVAPDCKHPLAHGYILDNNGQLQSLGQDGKDVIDTLADGFDICEYIARQDEEHRLDAVTLFQQMMAADLAFDERARSMRYWSLPEEERAKYEKKPEKN